MAAAQPQITLYHYWRSSASWRVRWALNHKNIAYKSVTVNLLKGEQQQAPYLQINPAGTVPCIERGGVVAVESMAMMEWLEEICPSPPLLPQSAADRLIVRMLTLVVVADTHPIQNLKVMRSVSTDQNEREKFAAHWINEGIKTYEALLRQHRCSGTYSFGGEVTMADMVLVPQCYNALRFGVDLSQYPLVNGIYQRCLKLPACDKAAPQNQPDAVK